MGDQACGLGDRSSGNTLRITILLRTSDFVFLGFSLFDLWVSLIKECDLPADRPYVFGYHPHGECCFVHGKCTELIVLGFRYYWNVSVVQFF